MSRNRSRNLRQFRLVQLCEASFKSKFVNRFIKISVIDFSTISMVHKFNDCIAKNNHLDVRRTKILR